MGMKPVCWLLVVWVAESMRSFMRAPFIFDHVAEIRCDSASSEECKNKCLQSEACQAAYFDVSLWRTCLMDLGKHCKFTPLLFLSTPVQSPTRSCADDTAGALVVSLPTTKVDNAYTFDDNASIGARWSFTGDVEKCKAATFIVEVSQMADDYNTCTMKAPNKNYEKYVSVKPEIFEESKKLMGVTVQTDSAAVRRAAGLTLRVTIEQDELKHECLLREDAANHMPEVRFIYQGTLRPQMGYDSAKGGLLRLDERGEFYIGTAPRGWKSY